ncbi:MAG: VOC family protein [Trueperaceae bacterium]|nr:VOC family protein [Trueperaceae bacterium]
MSRINWFEIPVTDMTRATQFYGQIFGITLKADPAMPGYHMAMFPSQGGVDGALLQGEGYTPSKTGSLVYLNGGEDLAKVLNRVEAAGGKILQPKTSIGENGFMAFFEDTEGNKIGLHSMH